MLSYCRGDPNYGQRGKEASLNSGSPRWIWFPSSLLICPRRWLILDVRITQMAQHATDLLFDSCRIDSALVGTLGHSISEANARICPCVCSWR
jgi:hypothetical protein